VNGNPEIPIRAVLHGLEGPITVEGEDFMNKMTPLGERLADKQIARILTFVRASWGNAAPPVTEAEVARVRAATADRTDPWTAPELEAIREDLEPGGEQ
jgi:mono/diheme cytochrome c family protein